MREAIHLQASNETKSYQDMEPSIFWFDVELFDPAVTPSNIVANCNPRSQEDPTVDLSSQ